MRLAAPGSDLAQCIRSGQGASKDLRGMKHMRDEVRQSLVAMVVTIGVELEKSMPRYVQAWVGILREKLTPQSYPTDAAGQREG